VAAAGRARALTVRARRHGVTPAPVPEVEELLLSLEDQARLRARHLAQVARCAGESAAVTVTNYAMHDAAAMLRVLADRSDELAP
jgi:hypothetical protein